MDGIVRLNKHRANDRIRQMRVDAKNLPNHIDFATARRLLTVLLNRSIAEQLKILLETKHLYQSVAVAFSDIAQRVEQQILLDNHLHDFQDLTYDISFLLLTPSEKPLTTPDGKLDLPTLVVQNIKIYCPHCREREAFSPTTYRDVTQDIVERHKTDHRIVLPPRGLQFLTLVYQCENCREALVTFLIRRQDWKFSIQGRSPIELVEVPDFMPKGERWLFSDAIVAHQSGKTLAGLFYLRSFIEQFARRQTGIKDRKPGETILDAYQSMLPEKQRDHMPSLRYWYEKLSEPLHEARQDAALFEEGKAEIVRHFDFRRLYKIAEIETTEKPEPPKKGLTQIG